MGQPRMGLNVNGTVTLGQHSGEIGLMSSLDGAGIRVLVRLVGAHRAWTVMVGILVVCGCAHVGPERPPEEPSGPDNESVKRDEATNAHYSEWIGHYPSDTLGDPPRELLNTPSVENTLKHMLSPNHYGLVRRTLTLETPVECIDGFLVVMLREPHNAPGRNAVLLFGAKDEDVMVIVYEASSGSDDKGCTTCYSTGRAIRDLPDGVKEAILEMHIPRMHDGDRLLPESQWLNDVSTKVVPYEGIR